MFKSIMEHNVGVSNCPFVNKKNGCPWKKRRDINDPVSYAPYSDDNIDQRIQSLLCLSDTVEWTWQKQYGDKLVGVTTTS